jgi:hypothetical protein
MGGLYTHRKDTLLSGRRSAVAHKRITNVGYERSTSRTG